MAKKKRKITNYAKKLLTSISPLTSTTNKSKKRNIFNNYLKVTSIEANEIISSTYVPSNTSNHSANAPTSGILEYFQPSQMNIVKKKLDYEKMSKLAPELEQASLIVIPSILSPNSFRNFKTSFTIDLPESVLSVDLKNKISEIINNHANVVLKIHENLESWIKEALYKTGAKPLLIIPPQIVNSIRNSSISFEEFYDGKEIIFKNDNISLEELQNNVGDNTDMQNLISLINTQLSEKRERKVDNTKKIQKAISGSLEEISKVNKEKDLIEFSDNPAALLTNKKAEKITNDNIRQKYQDHFNDPNHRVISFKQEPVLSLDDYYDKNDDMNIHPTIEELPTESVIPLYIEGSPHKHIGYFVILDEYGSPISISEEDYDEFFNGKDERVCGNHLDNLYKTAFGDNSLQSKKSHSYKRIHEYYLDQMIRNNLKGIGFNNISPSFNTEINKVMLYRLFKNKKTKLVFIPEVLLTYFAFNYNSDGTGRSKLDDIIFPLSLKITYLVTKMINLMEESIHRQNVKVDLDETAGNPLEILQAIKEKLIEGKISEITYDPIKIIKNIAEREIRITPNNIPGINQFSIDAENITSNRPAINDKLIEEANNLIMLNLDVPPSAFNQLAETEYSRSIVVNNILFSKKIELRQNVVIKHISNLMKSYVLLDNLLIKDIREVIKKERGDIDINKELFLIIQNIKLVLPTLRISHDKADFEEINNYIDMIEGLLDKLFPSELVADRDNQDTLATITSMLKSNIIKDYLADTQIIKHLNETIMDLDENFDISDITDINQFVTNTKKALDDIKSKLAKESDGY